METFLILRLGAMGDVLHGLPAVIELHKQRPDWKIEWVIEQRWRPLLPACVTPIEVHTRRWRKTWSASDTRNEIRALRQHGSQDVGVDLQGSMKSAVLGRWLRPKLFLGSAHPRELPARFFYDGMVEIHAQHVIDQAFELVEAASNVSLSSVRQPLDPFVTPAEADAAADRVARLGKFALLNPGAGWKAKEWPVERYSELARCLIGLGIVPVINCGPGEEPLGMAVIRECPEALAVLLSIGELIALLRRASLFVGGDTGPMHLAAMLGVPTVALFGPTDPARNGPYYPRSRVVRHPLSRTSYRHVADAESGLRAVSVRQVLETVREVLA